MSHVAQHNAMSYDISGGSTVEWEKISFGSGEITSVHLMPLSFTEIGNFIYDIEQKQKILLP